MITEREVVLKIIKDDPSGISELFLRHAALFREALLRFYGQAGIEEAEPLARVIEVVRRDLKEGRFDDLEETFYNWIVRRTWVEFLSLRLKDEAGDHADPDLIYQCADKRNEADLTDEKRSACRGHTGSCPSCRDLQEKCRDIPLEVRHAGAPCPGEFEVVKARVLEILGSAR